MKLKMKVAASVICMFFAGTISAQDRVKMQDKLVIKAGADTNGVQDFPSTTTGTITDLGTSSNSVEPGYSILVEFQHPVAEYLSIGLGATYNFDRGVGNAGGKFSFLPVYATASLFPLGNAADFSPYAKTDLGLNVSYTGNDAYKFNSPFETTLTGGVYWGVGAGAKIGGTLFVDIMYTAYAGTYHVALGPLSADSAILYTKISLNAGIGFNL